MQGRGNRQYDCQRGVVVASNLPFRFGTDGTFVWLSTENPVLKISIVTRTLQTYPRHTGGEMGCKSCSGGARWQNKYAAALHETDTYRLARCIEAAESAALVRLEAIAETGAGNWGERDAIADALAHLAILKRERLGFYALPVEPLCDDQLRVA